MIGWIWRRLLSRPDPVDRLIKPPRVTYRGFDAAASARAADRRRRADEARQRAAAIQTGATST